MFRLIKKISANWKLFPKLFGVHFSSRIISEICVLAIPYLASQMIDSISTGQWGKRLFILAAIYFAIAFIDNLTTRLTRTTFAYLSAKIQVVRLKEYMKKFLAIDHMRWQEEGTGKIITKIQSGVDAELTMWGGILKFVTIACIRIGVIVTIYVFQIPLILVGLLVGLLLIGLIARWSQKKVKGIYEELKDINEDTQRQATKIVMEKMLITLSGKQSEEIEKIDTITSKQAILSRNSDFLNNIGFQVMDVIFRLFEIACYLFVGWQIIQGSHTIGELVMLTTYTWYLWWPISIIGEEMGSMRKNRSRYEALHSFLDEPSKIINGTMSYEYKKGDIVIENIDFSYDKGNVLSGLSLHIDAGKTTALVGHSGSGKSTLVKLLLRLYDVQKGEIRIDDQKITELDINSLYEHVGYLSQEPAIFDGTIKENLAYAWGKDQNFSLEEAEKKMRAALEKAHIIDLIQGYEKGLDTELGEKGVKLSGGERQRLALARIFLKDPSILILDEPTSALDSISEAKITTAMNELMKKRTVIVIAHRLQTVMHADTIIVMEKGQVIQKGKHELLMQESGIYKTLVDLQHGVIQE